MSGRAGPQLGDVAAHLSEPDARPQAHLWLLTVAAETLDISELNRQVRALERLGEESRRRCSSLRLAG